jgi:hypothetical protein
MYGDWGCPNDVLTDDERRQFFEHLSAAEKGETDDFPRVKKLIKKIEARILDTLITFRVEKDNEFPNGRIFIQPTYFARCTKSNQTKNWHGRKWYLSRHMTDDEIIKTAFAAFEGAVKHEVLEGFRINGKALFNPHTNYEALLEISDVEVKRFEN